MTISKEMAKVLRILRENPESYVRERLRGYEIGSSRVRVCGFLIDPSVSRSTLQALIRRGLVVRGKRSVYNMQQVGYFLAETGMSKEDTEA